MGQSVKAIVGNGRRSSNKTAALPGQGLLLQARITQRASLARRRSEEAAQEEENGINNPAAAAAAAAGTLEQPGPGFPPRPPPEKRPVFPAPGGCDSGCSRSPPRLPHGAAAGSGGASRGGLALAAAAAAVAAAMNSGGLPCSSPVVAAAAGVAAAAAPVKLKFCRYYAKDKTCFYGEECQFLHEEPSAASAACPGPPPPPPPGALGGLPLGLPPGPAIPPVAASPGHGVGGGAGYPGHGAVAPVPKKPPELVAGGGGAGMDGPRLASESGRGWGRAPGPESAEPPAALFARRG
uniref:Uncharacterized protein n=1 Tax=Sphaerodactylus townsendi TaxID=933632 RepID=A0ACB8FGW8_9SAUR